MKLTTARLIPTVVKNDDVSSIIGDFLLATTLYERD